MNTLNQYFEHRAALRPDTTAVVNKDSSLTYAELNRRANRLAAILRDKGIRPQQMVAVLMDRSIEMIVATLGIIKAGGAYVPLDPSYPSERLALMLSETRAGVLITQSHLAAGAPPHRASVMEIDSDWGSNIGDECPDPANLNTSESLAYVMYTSGSTGRPKGVMVPHRAVMRLVLGANYVKLDSDSVVLQLAPVSFDASTFEIWGPLLNGGKCVLFPKNGPPDICELSAVLKEKEVNTLWLTASLFNTIVTESPEVLEGVSQLLTGGEALSARHVRMAGELFPDMRLINGYGPTETTTFAAAYSIPNLIPDTWNSIPIGYPITETDLYVLDDDMKRVQPGIEGELFIGGSGVALGYLDQPELTNQQFVSNPFSDDPNSRLYRTGDIVNADADGCIHFVGRKDDQVKVRGFRIELGEIEHVLNGHVAVRDAKVIVQQDATDQKRLVAYLICAKDEVVTNTDLRHFLEGYVPEYMIPACFVFLNSFPLSANGKFDRARLPVPGKERPRIDQHFVAPRNKLEKWLVEIWQDLLNLECVGVQDRFFELGGDSLQAARFINQIQKELGVSIPLVSIYNAFSIERFAKLLDEEFGSFVAKRLNLSIKQRSITEGGSNPNVRIERRGIAAARRHARTARNI